MHAANATRARTEEYHLLENLFNATRYNRRVRPVHSSEEPVKVTFGLVIKEIEDLVRRFLSEDSVESHFNLLWFCLIITRDWLKVRLLYTVVTD